ncbi:hypothetical protein GCM10028833_26850 [Glycomyces tarimensis]
MIPLSCDVPDGSNYIARLYCRSKAFSKKDGVGGRTGYYASLISVLLMSMSLGLIMIGSIGVGLAVLYVGAVGGSVICWSFYLISVKY